MFADAKVIAPPTTKAKKSAGNEVQVDGLYEIAAIDLVIKNLESAKSALEGDVKNQVRDIFINNAEKTGKRPSNFRGIDGPAEASCELRKRSTRSVLTEDEANLLTEANIPFETVTDIEETFVINPAYASDQKLLAKIEKALKGIKDLPEDFIMKQQGATRKVVSDETIDTVFEKKLGRKFLDIVALIALKPQIKQPSIVDAFKMAQKFLSK